MTDKNDNTEQPKTAAQAYANFINKQDQSSMTSKSSGPVTNDEIARATGKLPPKNDR